MMQTKKAYEKAELSVLVLREDVVTASAVVAEDYDKGINDIFVLSTEQ